MQRNYDPALHPLQVAREYTRALNSAKLSRMFAKPFLGSMDGHTDSITVLSRHPHRLSYIYTGAADGEVRLWDLSLMKCMRHIRAHSGMVRGICHRTDGDAFFTVGDDKMVKRWSAEQSEDSDEPISSIMVQTIVTSISHARARDEFVTCGETCQLWHEERRQPLATYSWGVDSLSCVRFNPVETHLIAACASDRSIILYDTREVQPLRRVITKLRSNTLAWNPMEAYIFTAANEDYNLYSWDMRKLGVPLMFHQDHVNAVIDVDYSPTGREFVSGGFDCSLRIFNARQRHSRDIYHTRRMQRVSCVCWSGDDTYIVSGSNEMNVRLWKARASQKLGVLKQREKAARLYNDQLLQRFGQHPQVRRISRHRHVPRHVRTATREHHAIRNKRQRKEANRRAHSKPGTVPYTSQNASFVVAEDE